MSSDVATPCSRHWFVAGLRVRLAVAQCGLDDALIGREWFNDKRTQLGVAALDKSGYLPLIAQYARRGVRGVCQKGDGLGACQHTKNTPGLLLAGASVAACTCVVGASGGGRSDRAARAGLSCPYSRRK